MNTVFRKRGCLGFVRRFPTNICCVLLLFAQLVAVAGEPVLKSAIFVVNRATNVPAESAQVLEDFLTSRLTDKGFSIISREAVIGSLKESDLDRMLSESASALRLAQMMGADYVLMASISSFGSRRKLFKGHDIATVNIDSTLRVSYKILDGIQGGSLVADTVTTGSASRETPDSRTEDTDILNRLLDEASTKIADRIKRPPPPANPTVPARFTVVCGLTTPTGEPLSVPSVRIGEENRVVIEKNRFEVQALEVTVKLNGVVKGSSPTSNPFEALPGLHKIQLERTDCDPWNQHINIRDGLAFKVALRMSDEGYRRWQETVAFLKNLENNKKLTNAEVKVLEGYAQMLRHSGYKINVDIKEDKTTRSLW